MCGSQGAVAVNDAVDAALNTLLKNFNVVHLRGQNNLKPELDTLKGYKAFGFVEEDLKHLFALSDIVLSRAGANAIFELLALNLPALLIPLPLSASRGDQILNAEHFLSHGWSDILYQEDLTPDTLISHINKLYENRQNYKTEMEKAHASQASERIIATIKSVIKK
jgi:UDP-N-acetylglucosamine--N-acetylmuramyl-(pentapeptide) pyrophosphoryl-undecaprenol N-acetylglucosamine transferase